MVLIPILYKVVLASLLIASTSFSLFAQSESSSQSPSVTYQSPVRIPVSLSGNYGELRSGRHHAGIDFRAYGKVGDPIHAVADGYIARVTVGASGYGNGIYLSHPDGRQTVYGHLHRFIPPIAERVRQEQYAQHSFAVDLSFAADEFPVKAGDIIGYIGNSGSSGAPHLHFEIRTPDQSGALNPLRAGVVRVRDTKAPRVDRIAFVGCFEDSAGVVHTEEVASFQYGTSKILSLPPCSYMVVHAVDVQDGTPAKLGVESYRLWLDDELIFDYQLGEYLFRENQSFHALIDYSAKQRGKGNGVKTWVEPGNEYRLRRPAMGTDGRIHLNDDEVHRLRLELMDEHGNVTERNFRVKRDVEKYADPAAAVAADTTLGAWSAWFLPRYVSKPGLEVGFFPGSFYRNVRVAVEEKPQEPGVYSSVWSIGDPSVALKRSARIRMRVEAPDSLQGKLLLARKTAKGKWVSAGGKVSGDTLRGSISSFGTYAVVADEEAPLIKPRFKNGADLRRSGVCAWTIRDGLSGIWSWEVRVDGQWVIGQYDAKFDKLWVELDEDVLSRGKKHRVEVTVRDGRNNISTKSWEFLW